MIKFWLRVGFLEREVLIPTVAIPHLLRIAIHEIGHAEVALHFGERVLGIAFELTQSGFVAQAFYTTSPNLSAQDKCTIIGAGSAGEVLVHGVYTEAGARGDRIQIAECDGGADYDAAVERARPILTNRRARFDRLRERLRWKIIDSNEELMIGELPMGKIGAFVLDEDEFELNNDASADGAVK